MKIMNSIYGAACVALAGILLGACANDEDVMTDGDTAKVPMTFIAGTVSTRTALGDDGMSVNWVKGDEIVLFDGLRCNKFVTQDEGATATFSGEANQTAVYTAFYPYDEEVVISNNTIRFNLPDEQTAVPDGFANGLVTSWAQTAEGSNVLQFHNLCALVKFTVGDDMTGDGSFILRGVNGEPLAGNRITYTIGGGETIVTPYAEVKLNGTFGAGQTYYFVVNPAELKKGLSIFYRDSKGKGYRRSSVNPVTFKAGTVTDLGTMSMDKFENAIVNVSLIKGIESYNSLTFEKNPDGSVSLNDANKKIIEGVSKLVIYNASLTDMFDIEFFTNLTDLSCTSCKRLKSFDVSSLTKLTVLDCTNNPLISSLDLSSLKNLESIKCFNNKLKSLDLSGLENLERIECYQNQLKSLDLNGLENLKNVDCNNNLLTTLDLSGLKNLETLNCYQNNLTQLDITANPGLVNLYCGGQSSNLTLYLTSTQKEKWNSGWESHPGNVNVTPVVKE